MNPQELLRLLERSAAAGQTVATAFSSAIGVAPAVVEAPLQIGQEALRQVERLTEGLNRLTSEVLRLGHTFTDFFTTVGMGFTRLTAIVDPFLRLIGGTPWLGDFQRSAAVLTTFFTNLGAIVTNTSNALLALRDITLSAMSGIVNLTTAAVRGFQTLLQIGQGLVTTFGHLAQMMQNALLAPLRVLGTVPSALKPIIGFGLAGAAIGSMAPGIGTAVGLAVGAGVGAIVCVVGQMLPTAFQALGAVIGGVLAGAIIKGLAGAFGYQLPVLAYGLIALFGPMLSRLMAQLLSVFGAIGDALGRLVQVIGDAVSKVGQAFGRLVEVTVAVAQRYIEALQGLWQMFGAVAARADTVGVALQTLARNAGISREQILGLWKALQEQNIALIEGGEAMTMLIARHPALLQVVPQLAEAAKDWAAAMGVETAHVFRMFSVAVTRGSMEMLEHLNIVYPATIAYQLFAAQIGKTAENLTYLEKSMAIANYLVNVLGRSVKGVYEETFDSLGKLLTSFQRVFQSLQVEAGRYLLPAFSPIARGFYDVLKTLSESLQQGGGLARLFASIGGGIVEGIRRAFGIADIKEFPKTLSQMIRQVIESPAFQQFAQRLGAFVATLTEYFARFLRWIVENLPQVLNRVLTFLQVFITVLAWGWNFLIGLGQAVIQVLQGMGVQLNLSGNVAVAVSQLLTFVASKIGEIVGKIFTFIGNTMTWIGEKLMGFGQWLAQHGELFTKIGKVAVVVFALIAAGFETITKLAIGFGTVMTGVVRILQAGYLALKGQFDAAQQALQQGWNLIKQGWQQQTEAMFGVPKKWGEWAKQQMQQLEQIDWAAISQKFQQAGQWFIERGQVWRQWGQTVQQVMDYASSYAQQRAQQIAQAFQQIVQPTKAAATTPAERAAQVLPEVFRVRTETEQILMQALEAQQRTLGEIYGTMTDIVALQAARVQLAWRIAQAELQNIQLLTMVLKGLATTKDDFASLQEHFKRLSEALATWAQEFNKQLDIAIGYGEKLGRILQTIADLPQKEFFFSPAAAMEATLWQEQLLQNQKAMLELWLQMPLGAEKFAEVTQRYVDVQSKILQLQYEMVSRPLKMILDGVDAVQRYWNTATNILRDFNMGMYGLLDIHLTEARVLAEKIRLLELQAQINRYNYQLYWQIHNQILETKRELFELARRPVIFFGLTRDQINRALTEAQTLMADPQFWARWRLGGPMLTEAAMRLAILRQQPGAAAVTIPDPRVLQLLGAGDLATVLGAYPIMRVWRLMEQVTGRQFPVDLRTVMMGLRQFLLEDIRNVPPPLMGPPPEGYFTQFVPQVWQEALRWGLPMPEFFREPAERVMTLHQGVTNMVMSLQELVRIGREIMNLLLNWQRTMIGAATPPVEATQRVPMTFPWSQLWPMSGRMDVSPIPIKDSKGRILGEVRLYEDVVERIAEEKALQTLHNVFRRSLRGMPTLS